MRLEEVGFSGGGLVNKGQNKTAAVGGVPLCEFVTPFPAQMINCAKEQQSEGEKVERMFCLERRHEAADRRGRRTR